MGFFALTSSSTMFRNPIALLMFSCEKWPQWVKRINAIFLFMITNWRVSCKMLILWGLSNSVFSASILNLVSAFSALIQSMSFGNSFGISCFRSSVWKKEWYPRQIFSPIFALSIQFSIRWCTFSIIGSECASVIRYLFLVPSLLTWDLNVFSSDLVIQPNC